MSRLYPHQQALLDSARATGGSLHAISDDDACATCAHCLYNPGMTSSCSQGWPATPDADGYITECAQHLQQDYPGQNLPTAIWLQQQVATMPVETDLGTEQRPIDTVRIDRHGQRVEPTLRPGEEAFHSIDGRCHVIDTGNRN